MTTLREKLIKISAKIVSYGVVRHLPTGQAGGAPRSVPPRSETDRRPQANTGGTKLPAAAEPDFRAFQREQYARAGAIQAATRSGGGTERLNAHNGAKKWLVQASQEWAVWFPFHEIWEDPPSIWGMWGWAPTSGNGFVSSPAP